MAIISIIRDCGMNPSIVRIISTNTLAEIGATNYLYDQRFIISEINSGEFQWSETDFILVKGSNGWGQFTISSNFKSLIAFAVNSPDNGIPYAENSGLPNNYLVNLTIPITEYQNGFSVFMYNNLAANTLTISTISVDGLDSKPIYYSALINYINPGDIAAGSVSLLVYNSNADAFFLQYSLNSLNGSALASGNFYNYVVDSGTANNYIAQFNFLGVGSIGLPLVYLKAANSNSGASTLQIKDLNNNSILTASIVLNNGSALSGGEILSNGVYILQYDGTNFKLINSESSSGVTALQVQSNQFNYGVIDPSSTSTNYVVNLTPAPLSFPNGMCLYMDNTHGPDNADGIVNLSVNGFNYTMVDTRGALLTQSAITNQGIYQFILGFPSGNAILINPWITPASAQGVQGNIYNAGNDVGTTNAYKTDLLTASGTAFATEKSIYWTIAASTNTGACTIANGIETPVSIKLANGSDPVAGDIVSGSAFGVIMLSGPIAQLINPVIS